MREILFRAKRIDNGEWVYGLLLEAHLREYREYGSNFYIVRGYAEHKDDSWNFLSYLVDEETIEQYTGLTDKNGTKIFEGDIVDVEYDVNYVGVAAERIGMFEVVFCKGSFMKQNKKGLFHFIPSDKCLIVGNIHDNPELLGGWSNGNL